MQLAQITSRGAYSQSVRYAKRNQTTTRQRHSKSYRSAGIKLPRTRIRKQQQNIRYASIICHNKTMVDQNKQKFNRQN